MIEGMYRTPSGEIFKVQVGRESRKPYGVCCVCGSRLKDAESVANGIGPVCAKRTTWREQLAPVAA